MSAAPLSPSEPNEPMTAATRPAARCSRKNALLSFVVLAILGGALWLRREPLGQAFTRIADLPPLWLAAVLGATSAMVVARALMVAAATPGLAPHKALAADQVQQASSNAVVGGGPIGASAKVGMMHSWGIKSDDIATSLIATAVAPALVTWGIALMLFWPAVVLGDAGRTELVLAVLGTVQIVGFCLLLWIALTKPVLAAFVGRLAAAVLRRAERLVPRRFGKIRGHIASADPHDFLERLRQDGQRLARRHGAPTLLATVAFQASTWVLLWAVLHGIGVTKVSIGEVVIAMVLVRALISITPTPGGIGVAELSLITSLTNAGGDHSAVAAAVVLFRSLTYLLPMVLGAGAWMWWRRPLGLSRVRA